MQAGIMPLQGIGASSGAPSGAFMAMLAIMSAPTGMATADSVCSVDALKNATANSVQISRLRWW